MESYYFFLNDFTKTLIEVKHVLIQIQHIEIKLHCTAEGS